MKIIQIAVSSGGNNGCETWSDIVYGLSDKGDLYINYNGRWCKQMSKFNKQEFDKELAYEAEQQAKSLQDIEYKKYWAENEEQNDVDPFADIQTPQKPFMRKV